VKDRAPSSRAVRGVFAVIFLALPAQMVITSRFSEPYPAITQPGFQGRGVEKTGRYERRSAEFLVEWDDGNVEGLRPSVLLPFWRSFRQSILWHNFRPRSERRSPPPELVPPDFSGASGLERLVKRLMPGYVIHEAKRHFEPEPPPQTRDWLRSRLETLFPDQCPIRVRVQWYRDEYRLSHGVTRERYPTGTFEIELDHEGCRSNE